jgi:hypothetical protein
MIGDRTGTLQAMLAATRQRKFVSPPQGHRIRRDAADGRSVIDFLGSARAEAFVGGCL